MDNDEAVARVMKNDPTLSRADALYIVAVLAGLRNGLRNAIAEARKADEARQEAAPSNIAGAQK